MALLDIFITERGNYLIVGRGEEEGGAEGGRGGEGGRKRGWEGRRGGGEKVVNFELSSVKWACFTYTLTAFDYFLFGLKIIFMGVPVFVKTSGVSKELLFWKSVGSIMQVLLIIFVIFK